MRLLTKKCLVVLDTNLIYLRGEDRRYEFIPKDSFLSFLEWIETNNVHDICVFAVPEIVLCEISKQKFDQNTHNKSKCVEFSGFFDIVPEISEQSFEACYAKVKGCFNSNDIVILPNPSGINKIIERAVHKKKPFTGQEGASDKGFKDAVALHSITEIENVGDFEKVFWLTKNKQDFTKEIEAERDNLTILNSERTIEDFKKIIIDDYIWKQKLVKYLDVNKSSILAYINDMVSDVTFIDFSYNQNLFILDKVTNMVQFSVCISASGDSRVAKQNVKQNTEIISVDLLFDLNANEIIDQGEKIEEGFPWEQELHDQVMAKKAKFLDHIYKYRLIVNSEMMKLWPEPRFEIVNESIVYNKDKNQAYFVLKLIYEREQKVGAYYHAFDTSWIYHLDSKTFTVAVDIDEDALNEDTENE